MTRRNLIIFIVITLILILGYGGWLVILSGLNTNAFSKKKLSAQEKHLINKLSEECDCQVYLEHDSKFSEEQTFSDTPLVSLVFRMVKGKGFEQSYSLQNDLCQRPIDFLIAHALNVTKELIQVVDYKEMYNAVNVYYTTLEIYSEDGSASKFACYKRIRYSRNKNGTWKLMDAY